MPGTRLLYGVLPLPGRIGQLVQWETGTYLLLCAGLMAVLLTCRAMRADEDDGLVELQLAVGIGRWAPLVAPVVVSWGAIAMLALGVGVILTGLTQLVTELTVPGAWTPAGSVANAGWAFIALSALICQLCRQAVHARGLTLVGLSGAFALRVLADESGTGWMRWFSPLAWRDLVYPYTNDDPVPLAVCAAICVALVAIAGALYTRREYGTGYLPDRSTSARRWHVRGYTDLLARLAVHGSAIWAATVAATSALFGAMAGGIAELLVPGSATGSYVGKMAEGSPVEQYLSLLTIVTVLLVVVAAAQRVNTLVLRERTGLIDLKSAVGISRTRLFVTQGGMVLVEATGLLMLSGGVLAAATGSQLTEDHAVARAFVFTVSQLPGLLAAIGIALAVVGVAPRRFGIVWAVIAWSVFARFFGGLLELPRWARNLSMMGHHLDVVGDPDWVPLAVQAAVGVAGTAVGLVAYRRRDLSSA
ncbi:Tat pathway signal protein [Actinomyces ruminicola]|nr:Tat pathway signal protein [Actinomyces ruminicola]